jgi:hypothetical protein
VTSKLRKLTLGVLYSVVALLVAVPPVYIMARAGTCDVPPCTMTSSQLFKGDTILFWMLPFSIAAVVLAFAFKLKSRR